MKVDQSRTEFMCCPVKRQQHEKKRGRRAGGCRDEDVEVPFGSDVEGWIR